METHTTPGPFGRANARTYVVAVALVLLVAAAYHGIGRCGFVEYDDNRYVYENPEVERGLTPYGVVWAFTTFSASNWHPLTWLSHMADVSTFGVKPAWHHRVNVAFHAGNAVLVFLALTLATGATWRSGFVAALFAVHPAHVESVAWIAERKDVLSTFFGMLALVAYVGYARRPTRAFLLLVATAFACSLMAKPMLVTLPLLLLVFDVWPLGRLPEAPTRMRSAAHLVREKLPLFVLAGASCIVTLLAQSHGGAVSTVEGLSIGSRFANAALALVFYVKTLVWPTHLAVFYPHPGVMPGGIPAWKVAASTCAIAALTWTAARQRAKRPYLLVGWLWFIVALLPVLGIVHVGFQGAADRYTYVPSIGLFIAAVWAVAEASRTWNAMRYAVVGAGCFAIASAGWIAHVQMRAWRDTYTLFTQATEAVPDSWLAWKNVGVEDFRQGRLAKAREAFQQALRTRPGDADTWLDLGYCCGALERHAEAEDCFRKALAIRPEDADAWAGLGVACTLLERQECATEAVLRLRRLDSSKASELETRIKDLQSRP